jgi:hypothetical protein
MDKFSQSRGLLNKLHEKTNVSGRILESINPDFQKMMDKLRSTDERVRSHADQIKKIVNQSKSLVNRRDYLQSATSISVFHERCRWIAAELKKFIGSVDMKHYKFLLDQFDDEQKEKLFGYDPNKEIEIKDEDTGDVSLVDDKIITAALKKQAGPSDWWFNQIESSPLDDMAHNLTTQRGIAMRQMEKKFSIAFLKDLKVSTHIMVVRTVKFLQFLLGIFKRLATALAKRNVDQYVIAAKTFISKFAGYHDQFVTFYTKSIVPLKEQHEKLLAEVEQNKAKKMEQDAAKQRENAARQRPAMPNTPARSQMGRPIPVAPGSEQSMYAPGNLQDMLSKEQDEENTKIRPGNRDNIPLELKRNKAEFIANIEKLADADDPKSIALEILAYSEKLEDSDPDLSLKLLAVAEGLIEDYKIAGIFDFSKPLKPVTKIPEQPKKKDEPDLLGDLPVERKKPLDTGMKEGRVDQRYTSIPVLSAIGADRIRVTPQAARHIASIFVKRLYDLNMDVGGLDMSLEAAIINEIRKSAVRGVVLNNNQSDDTHNPLDRQIEIYTYLNLKDINPALNGIAKFKVLCRLSLSNGTLSLRTISRNFLAE